MGTGNIWKYQEIAGMLCPQRLGKFHAVRALLPYIHAWFLIFWAVTVQDFSKTSTPMPEGAATMFGEDLWYCMPVWQIGRTHCRHKISQVVWLVVGLYVLQYGMHVNQAACILRQFVDPQRRVQLYNAWSRESTRCLELILTSSGATRWAGDNFSEIRPATKTRPRVGLCESAWPCQQVNKFHYSSLQDPLSLKASPLFVELLIFWEMACFEANLQYLRPGFACPRLRLPDGEQR